MSADEIAGSHDAELQFKVPSGGHSPDWLITWRWVSGRWTVSPTEQDEMECLIAKAEDEIDEEPLEAGDVVARIWMSEDETVDQLSWIPEDISPDGP